MRTFHPNSEQSPNGQVDQSAAYLDEIRQLRQRVVVLEAALAAAEATCANQNPSVSSAPPITSIDFGPVHDEISASAVECSSEFAAASEPAVQAATTVEPGTHVTTPSFADAWEEEATSFEERFAERAFFHASSVDEESRNWLLDT